MDVYIATAAGLPNGTLLAAVQADLQERREIAVDVQVKAPAAVEMDVSAELAVREGADFSAVKAPQSRLWRAFSAAAGWAGRYCWRSWGTCCTTWRAWRTTACWPLPPIWQRRTERCPCWAG